MAKKNYTPNGDGRSAEDRALDSSAHFGFPLPMLITCYEGWEQEGEKFYLFS